METEAPVLLSHSGKNGASKDESVTTLDWDPTGCYLATGAYNGIARIWDSKGNLKQTLNKHEGPIFSLKWNNQGNYLLSGSADKTAIVWDTNTGEMKQQFFFHTGTASLPPFFSFLFLSFPSFLPFSFPFFAPSPCLLVYSQISFSWMER